MAQQFSVLMPDFKNNMIRVQLEWTGERHLINKLAQEIAKIHLTDDSDGVVFEKIFKLLGEYQRDNKELKYQSKILLPDPKCKCNDCTKPPVAN